MKRQSSYSTKMSEEIILLKWQNIVKMMKQILLYYIQIKNLQQGE